MPTDTSSDHAQGQDGASAPQCHQTATPQPTEQTLSAQGQAPGREQSPSPTQPSPPAPSSQQWTLLQQWTSPERTSPPQQWSSPQPLPLPEQGQSSPALPSPVAKEQPKTDASAQAQAPKADAAQTQEKGSDGQDKPPPETPKDNGQKDDAKDNSQKDGTKKDDPKADAAAKTKHWVKVAVGVAIVVVLIGSGLLLWQFLRPKGLGPGFASGNGRIEATELFVASKVAGRVSDIYVDEGDTVTSGQIVAKIDSDLLQDELQKTKAEQAQARNAVATALATVDQYKSQKVADEAIVAQRYSELNGAIDTAHRSQVLSEQHATSIQERDNNATSVKQSAAQMASAEAQVAAAQATIVSSQSKVLEARSNVNAAIAQEQHLKTQIAEDELKAARAGRVQFRVVQPGEVVDAGGKVISMVDMNDVSMTFFLPEEMTGKVRLGSEVHIVLDADPSMVIPAIVSFVGSVAQFTPKTVETQVERQKLVFRIKARVDPKVLSDHLTSFKSGLPGVAYVRLDSSVAWPDNSKLTKSAQ